MHRLLSARDLQCNLRIFGGERWTPDIEQCSFVTQKIWFSEEPKFSKVSGVLLRYTDLVTYTTPTRDERRLSKFEHLCLHRRATIFKKENLSYSIPLLQLFGSVGEANPESSLASAQNIASRFFRQSMRIDPRQSISAL